LRDIDAEAEAASVLVTIAGATARRGGLFALMVDEFEHLMAENQRHGTHRNATAVKRLLEGLSGAGALVLVAGHWRAWEQLPDFKARFAGQPPVDLVTLTGKEIGQLVMKALPEWGMRLDEAALEAVAERAGATSAGCSRCCTSSSPTLPATPGRSAPRRRRRPQRGGAS
jgi:hypothetical protein